MLTSTSALATQEAELIFLGTEDDYATQSRESIINQPVALAPKRGIGNYPLG